MCPLSLTNMANMCPLNLTNMAWSVWFALSQSRVHPPAFLKFFLAINELCSLNTSCKSILQRDLFHHHQSFSGPISLRPGLQFVISALLKVLCCPPCLPPHREKKTKRRTRPRWYRANTVRGRCEGGHGPPPQPPTRTKDWFSFVQKTSLIRLKNYRNPNEGVHDPPPAISMSNIRGPRPPKHEKKLRK